jgi:hypothetical protein
MARMRHCKIAIGLPLSGEERSCSGHHRDDRVCEGFRMPAADGGWRAHGRPASARSVKTVVAAIQLNLYAFGQTVKAPIEGPPSNVMNARRFIR